MNSLSATFNERSEQLLIAVLEHMQISFISIFIAVLIAVPLGIYISKKSRVAEPIIQITAVFQTVPSLALLGILIPFVGIGKIPAIVALVIYAILPILRNTYTGINEVDPILIEASEAMGMDRKKQLFKVELPLAMPMIMAGIRTAMVLIIGTATLGALIGAGGLGDLILLGIDRNNNNLILLGAIPAAILAITFDGIIRYLERVSLKTSLTAMAAGLVITISLVVVPNFTLPEEDITIAGKLGSEPEILINMYKLIIEQNTDLNVVLKPSMGKTTFLFNAIKSEDIDIYPEFTGTALAAFVKENAISHNPDEVYEQMRKGMYDKYGMMLLKPMKYNNTYAIATAPELAEEYNLNRISDLKNIESLLKPGFTMEFNDKDDGAKGIEKEYDLKFEKVKTMEPKLRYTAMVTGDINLVDAYSTDSELAHYNLKVLEDDKEFFPPYQGAPLMLEKTAADHPEIVDALNKLSGKITDDEMRKMNYEVNVNEKSAREVAEDYLKGIGLIQ